MIRLLAWAGAHTASPCAEGFSCFQRLGRRPPSALLPDLRVADPTVEAVVARYLPPTIAERIATG